MTDHLHEAGEIIAKAIKATADPHAGWLKYAAAGDAAVKTLIEAGWAPPGDGTADDRLRDALRVQQDETRRARESAYRIEAERDAAGAFRIRVIGLMFELEKHLTGAREAALAAGEPEPTYTGEQVMKWLRRNLDLGDKAADRQKAKSLTAKKTGEQAKPAGAADGLFEAAS